MNSPHWWLAISQSLPSSWVPSGRTPRRRNAAAEASAPGVTGRTGGGAVSGDMPGYLARTDHPMQICTASPP